MLAKCAIPSCPASFLYLDAGRLFRLETNKTAGSTMASPTTEYFWLCQSCSAGMTLDLAQDGTVVATGISEGGGEGKIAPPSRNREKGKKDDS